MDLLHYINIVEALETGLGPADVFQILQRALLAVHIVRTVTGVGQQAAFAEHGGHIGVVGGAVLHDDVGRALEGQRVDRDVFGVQRNGLTQAGLKALDGIPRQTRDQIHVDVFVPCRAGRRKAVNDVLRGVAAPDVLQHLIRKGLRIDRNACCTVFFDDAQLLGVGAVGAAGLDGVLIEFR